MFNGKSDPQILHTYRRNKSYKLLIIKDLVEAAGVGLLRGAENRQLIDFYGR
jgi:hypothetical protein